MGFNSAFKGLKRKFLILTAKHWRFE